MTREIFISRQSGAAPAAVSLTNPIERRCDPSGAGRQEAAAHSMVAGEPTLVIEPVEAAQWSFGRLNAHRPLSRITMDDAAGSVAHISGRTGELMRDTTRGERAWNWVGSVIHWIYFTPLRTHGEPWRQVVMWTSAVALLLAMLGIVLGIQRLRLKRLYSGARSSPYRGWQAWHHCLGLTLGTLTLTWQFSGWLSVTPFGWLSSPGICAQDRLANQAAFPALRVQFQLPDETTFYVDAAQGQLAGYADNNSKWNRWLFNGLHQLDFAAVVRARPVWDVMVVSLCLLGAMLAATGLVLGYRRLNKYK